MIIRILAKQAFYIALVCAFAGSTSSSFGATPKKTIPTTITTEKGKTFQSAELVSVNPDGLVIQYKPQAGGLGVTKVKFRDLPENLRREFNYDESAANEFEAATRQAMTLRDERNTESAQPRAVAEQKAAQPVETFENQDSPSTRDANALGAGRFLAAGTIRGAMILDSVTGEAWLVDLHSTLEDYKDRSYFLRPKVSTDESKAIVIGP